MRGRDDHAAANQRHLDALYIARRRAVAECQGRLVPKLIPIDRALPDAGEVAAADDWDGLNVGYLRAEWPPSMLN